MSAKPRFITFTGIDAQTDLARCEALSVRYPIEWGVLFGGKLGKNRYPDDDVVARAVSADIQRAAHLCNAFAEEVNDGGGFDLAGHFDRIQVNRATGCYNLDALAAFAATIATEVIVQHRSSTFPEPISGLAFLQDQSGGRGQLPSYWAQPAHPEQMLGYAGGLSPDTVEDAVRHMPAKHFWIDMETGIRTDDWLDLDKCEAVCRAIFGDGFPS